MKFLFRHLPLITNRIEFQLDGIPHALPLITPRIDFSDFSSTLRDKGTDIQTSGEKVGPYSNKRHQILKSSTRISNQDSLSISIDISTP